ncbi:unnamed protein product [Dracunculus medinensis]|uniref:Reverse transcriptase domain-containing protein n=1 Tax=Dracunculus medinensis TaxID=318479 RepID=A0A0N4UFN6_DRAME|nr:unnamed protein product [Dracunculus medinensis]
MCPEQAGFRPWRGCADQIFTLEHRFATCHIVTCFIDFVAAFDSIDRGALWWMMERDDVSEKIIRLIKAVYERMSAKVCVYGELTESFEMRTGVYEELYSLRKTTQRDSHLPSHRHAGFIIISFKVLDGQTNIETLLKILICFDIILNNEIQLQSLEKSWLAWTGAREIYKYSPRNWNLRQISFLRLAENKNLVGRPFPYVVTCEFGTIFHPSNRLKAMDLCERLRIRNCGYISLYQVQGSFANNHIGITPNKDSNKSGRRTMLRGFSLDVTEAGNSSRRHKSPRLHGRNRSIIYNHEENSLKDFFILSVVIAISHSEELRFKSICGKQENAVFIVI